MSLSKLASSTPKQTAPAATQAAAPPDAVESVPADRALTLFPDTPGVTVADALTRALSTESRATSPFAVVNLTGGPSGGMFAPADFLPQEVQDALPSGKKPIAGVLMGYRLAMSAWPAGYTDQPAGAEKAKPVWSCAISANDIDNMPLAMKAARNYQFTKSADKGKFDFAQSKVGHVRLAVELLVYLPETGQPVVVSTPSNYGAVEATLQNIQKLVDAKTGALGQFPCAVRPVTEEKSSKGGFTWKQHSLDITNVAGTPESVAHLQSYGAWRAEAMKDAGVVQGVRDWVSARDRAVTADIKAAMIAGASL